MTRLHADVVVVGAGPAGSLTALLLARAGIDVLLLDRAVFPRAKPCGDCLSAQTTHLLARNGLLGAVHALPHGTLHGWRIFAPGGGSFAADFDDPGSIAVERRAFDHCLLGAAAAAGARVLESSKVIEVRLTEGAYSEVTLDRAHARGTPVSLRTRFIVGADGLRSVVARRLRAIRRRPHVRKFSLTMHVDALLPFESHGEMHMGTGLCVGIAPVTAALDRWNVTVVADAARFGRIAAVDQRAFFDSALRALPGVRGRIETPGSAQDVLASGPFDVPTRRISFPGAALVGDAAGYFDPFTGQGVYQGMRGAELLAADLTAALADGEYAPRLPRYEQQARSLARATRRLQRLIDAVLSNPALADRAIARLARAPRAAQALLAVTGDVLPVRTLLAPRVALQFAFPRSIRSRQ